MIPRSFKHIFILDVEPVQLHLHVWQPPLCLVKYIEQAIIVTNGVRESMREEIRQHLVFSN